MPSLRQAINAKCKECIYDPIGRGTWRQQVEACTSYACPLYPIRPKAMLRRKDVETSSADDMPRVQLLP